MKIFSYGLVIFLSCVAVVASDENEEENKDSASQSSSIKKEEDVSLKVMQEQCKNAIKSAKAKKPDSKTLKRLDEASDLLASSSDADVPREAKIASCACCIMKTMGNYRCSVSTIKEQVKNKLSQLFE